MALIPLLVGPVHAGLLPPVTVLVQLRHVVFAVCVPALVIQLMRRR